MSPSACNSVRHKKKTRHETNNPTNTHRNSPHCNPRTLQTMTNNIQTKHTLPLTPTRAIPPTQNPPLFTRGTQTALPFNHHSCPRTSRTCACRASAQVCFSRFVVACGHPSKLNDVLGKSRGGLPRSVPGWNRACLRSGLDAILANIFKMCAPPNEVRSGPWPCTSWIQ